VAPSVKKFILLEGGNQLADYCLVAIIGIVLFVLIILDLIDELKR
jgi:hypothetical protein